MILAETVSIDGGAIALILGVILVLFLAWVGLMVWGCKLAVRAGRGSQPDLIRWILVGAIELFLGIPLLPVTLIGLAVQVWLYLRERTRGEQGGEDR
jgi:hypothetical protein